MGWDEAGLDGFPKRVAEHRGRGPDPSWGQEYRFGEHGKLQLFFGRVSSAKSPVFDTSVWLKISWGRPRREFVGSTGTLRPPPGYEHISMEPYPVIVNGVALDLGGGVPGDYPPSGDTPKAPPVDDTKPDHPLEAAEAVDRHPVKAWWVATGIVAALGIVFVLVRRCVRRGS